MNAKVLRVLEYDKVIHMLEQKATSDPGRQLCRDLVPMTDLAQIEQAQTETADALTRIFQKELQDPVFLRRQTDLLSHKAHFLSGIIQFDISAAYRMDCAGHRFDQRGIFFT